MLLQNFYLKTEITRPRADYFINHNLPLSIPKLPYNNGGLGIFALFLSILFFCCGCSSYHEKKSTFFNSTVNNNESIINSVSIPKTIEDEKNERIPKFQLTEPYFNVNTLYGHWVITDVAFREFFAISKDGQGDHPTWAEDLIGSIIEYKKDALVFNGKPYKINSVESELVNFNVFMIMNNFPRYAHSDFMMENGLESFEGYYVTIETENDLGLTPNFPELGDRLFVINEDHILLLDGTGYTLSAYRIEDIDNFVPPTPPPPPNPEYLYGSWIIEKNLQHIDNDFHVGSVFEYQKDFILLDGVRYENPLYSYDVPIPADLYFNDWYSNLDFGAASAQNTNEFIYPHNIFSNRTRISRMGYTALGAFLYYINENYIVLECLNDVFLASRVK